MGLVHFSVARSGTWVLAYTKQVLPMPPLLRTLDGFMLLKEEDIAPDTQGMTQTPPGPPPTAPG